MLKGAGCIEDFRTTVMSGRHIKISDIDVGIYEICKLWPEVLQEIRGTFGFASNLKCYL
jgi:hypothetical protein